MGPKPPFCEEVREKSLKNYLLEMNFGGERSRAPPKITGW